MSNIVRLGQHLAQKYAAEIKDNEVINFILKALAEGKTAVSPNGIKVFRKNESKNIALRGYENIGKIKSVSHYYVVEFPSGTRDLFEKDYEAAKYAAQFI